jgi:hypothetical protein
VLADLRQTTLYFPKETHAISGGVGPLNMTRYLAYKLPIAQYAPSLIKNVLAETRYVFPVAPKSTDCTAAGESCASWLLSGGLWTVRPFPFEDRPDTPYLTMYDTPSYQLDFWDGPEEFNWSPSECRTYGPVTRDGQQAFQVCATSRPDNPGHIIAGTSLRFVCIIKIIAC